jgi:hypothetical protein
MAVIKANFGSGGSGITPNRSAGTPWLAQILRDMADDFETIRANVNALNAKLDADSGVNDTDYASTLDIAPGGILTKKG